MPAAKEYLAALSSEIEQARCDQERIQRKLNEIVDSAPHGVPLSDYQREMISAGVAAQRAGKEFETAACRLRSFLERQSRAQKVFEAGKAQVRVSLQQIGRSMVNLQLTDRLVVSSSRVVQNHYGASAFSKTGTRDSVTAPRSFATRR